MLKTGLSNLAVILLLAVVFFILMTQRVMISSEVNPHEDIPIEKKNMTRTSRDKPLGGKGKVEGNIKFDLEVGSVQSTVVTIKPTMSPTRPPTITPTYSPTIVPTLTPTAKPILTEPIPQIDHIKFLDTPRTEIPTKSPAKSTSFGDHHITEIKEHPYMSPRKGSDISPAAQDSLIRCPNQSKCIVPELQLQKKYKIYLCKLPVKQGIRFYFLAREGLLLHPNVELLSEDKMYEADYIVYLPGSAPWNMTECNDPSLANRLIVMDEYDGSNLVMPAVGNFTEYAKIYGSRSAPWYYIYFKRSFVRREDGVFVGYPHLNTFDAYPMTYAVAEAYVDHVLNQKRDTDIWCTLRGSIHMTTRQRVQDWVAEYGQKRAITNIITKQVNHMDRKDVSKYYFETMYNSSIIVTVNPANWEGDFRLWEAMGSGALIFVDPIFVPHQFPLISGEHVVYFSNTNKTDLFAKLDYYRKNKDEARRIAVNGYLHAMKYHRTVNLIDYVLRTTHLKEATLAKAPLLPHYSYTGQYLMQEAKIQLEVIKQCQYPGIYDDPALKMHRNLTSLGIAAAEQHTKRLQCAKKGKAPGTNIQFLDRRLRH